MLRVITEFILFTRKDEELSKAILRPHQMRAVERTVQRAKDTSKRRGLIWHTQGSGKTYTMITVAKRLIEDPAFENPTVLMIVDRNELEAQLFGNLEAVGFGKVAVAESKKDLQKLLKADRRGLIVSMIHKFEDMPEKINQRSNVFVLVDEAHRTTGGDLGNYLMGALPNATYLGFTGTPIDRTAYGKGTFKIFGTDDPKGYLDKYSIRESVEDGTTVPLHYSLAPNELRVDRETLEKEFLELAELEGVSDVAELNEVLDRAVTLKNMLKNRDRVDKVAKFVAEHFRTNVEPMGYKAFMVAVDREACVFYKQALDKYLPPEDSVVVISPGGKKDQEHLRKAWLAEDEEKRIRKAFRNPDEKPKILIVTEKLLTGFDAPILYCMYLDKPMRDHVLLQAIARVNRPYEDDEGRRKPAGFVLDFVGIFEKLEKALAFDSKDVEGVVEGIDVLKERFEELMGEGRTKYLPIPQGKSGDKAVEATLEHFRDKEVRQEFYTFFNELEELYEILSPDALLRPSIDDYSRLTEMFRLLRANYERGVVVDKGSSARPPGSSRSTPRPGPSRPRTRSTSSTPNAGEDRRGRHARRGQGLQPAQGHARHGPGEGPRTALPDQHRRQGRGDRPSLRGSPADHPGHPQRAGEDGPGAEGGRSPAGRDQLGPRSLRRLLVPEQDRGPQGHGCRQDRLLGLRAIPPLADQHPPGARRSPCPLQSPDRRRGREGRGHRPGHHADAPEVVVVIAKETELAGWQPLEEMIPKEILRSEVEAWARRIKVEPKEIHVRPMTRKWGSCSTAAG